MFVTTIVLLGCTGGQADRDGPLLVVVWRGGLCPCGSTTTTFDLNVDGGHWITERDGTEVSGVIDTTLVDPLTDAEVGTDVDVVRLRRFTETCPTAYDRQEIIYAFHRPAGAEQLSTCEYLIEWELPSFPQALSILDTVGL